MKNILVIGSTGQIGSELTMELRRRYGNEHVVAGYIQGAEPKGDLAESGPKALADVTDGEAISNVVKDDRPGQNLPFQPQRCLPQDRRGFIT